MDIKAKLSLNDAEFKVKHAEIKQQLLELKGQKLDLQVNLENAKSQLSGFQQFANGLLGKITFGNLLATGITAGIELIKNAFMGLMNVFKESVNVSAKYETSLRGLESVSKAFGVSAQDATKSALS